MEDYGLADKVVIGQRLKLIGLESLFQPKRFCDSLKSITEDLAKRPFQRESNFKAINLSYQVLELPLGSCNSTGQAMT